MKITSFDTFEVLLDSSTYTAKITESNKIIDHLDSAYDLIIQREENAYYLPKECIKAFKVIKNKDEYIRSLDKVEIYKSKSKLLKSIKTQKEFECYPHDIVAYTKEEHSDFIYLINRTKQDLSVFEHWKLMKDLASVSNINSILSHDIRSPLSVINICCDYIMSLENHEEKLQDLDDFIGRMKRQALKGLHLTESLLKFLKSSASVQLDKSNIEIDDIILQSCVDYEFLASKKNISIDHNIIESTICVDPDRLTQVVKNILDNAIKFSPNDSTITISTEKTKNSYLVKIQDQGNGISPEKLRLIFNSFQQETKDLESSGFGLGLYIAKQFIELHGGHISVDSKLGEGTCFTIHIPMESRDKIEESLDPMVLIVDDDEDIRMLIGSILKKHGINSIEAKSGAEALTIFKDRDPKIVISDIRMPDMDGFELLESIKLLGSDNFNFIFLSGFYPNIDKEKAKKVFKAASFLKKPFEEKELIEVIVSQIGQLHPQTKKAS